MGLKSFSTGFNAKFLVNFGGFVFIVGIILESFYKIPGIIITLIGFIILLVAAIQLKNKEGSFRNGFLEELIVGSSERTNMVTKTMIIGIICSLVWLGVNLGLSWYQKKVITEQCRNKCCEYSPTHALWLYKCDTSLCCITVSANDNLQDCRMRFKTKELCVSYCSTDLKNAFFPDTFTSFKSLFRW